MGEKIMEFKDFICFLERNMTEDAFEAMALNFSEFCGYRIIKCDFRDMVKIYTLCHRYTSSEYYMVINYYNKILDPRFYPKDTYMILENNTDTLMLLCDKLYCSDRIKSRVPYCLKEICNLIFSFTKYPLRYFDYKAEHDFYGVIAKKQEKVEEMYVENLRILFQKCTREVLCELKNRGLLKNDKDWNQRRNTLTLTGVNGIRKQYLLHFDFDGFVEVTDLSSHVGFECYIVEDSDIQKFKERIVSFVC